MKMVFKGYGLLLTAAVAAGQRSVDTSYEMLELSRHLDFINLMAYDLHGAWEPTTGHQTDSDPTRSRNEISVFNSVCFS